MIVILLHDGRYDRVLQALSLAASACVSGEQVALMWFFWALERRAGGRLDVIDIETTEPAGPAASPAVARVAANLERFAHARPSELLAAARESGNLRELFCSASLRLLEIEAAEVTSEGDVAGWPTVVQLMEKARHVLFL